MRSGRHAPVVEFTIARSRAADSKGLHGDGCSGSAGGARAGPVATSRAMPEWMQMPDS